MELLIITVQSLVQSFEIKSCDQFYYIFNMMKNSFRITFYKTTRAFVGSVVLALEAELTPKTHPSRHCFMNYSPARKCQAYVRFNVLGLGKMNIQAH